MCSQGSGSCLIILSWSLLEIYGFDTLEIYWFWHWQFLFGLEIATFWWHWRISKSSLSIVKVGASNSRSHRGGLVRCCCQWSGLLHPAIDSFVELEHSVYVWTPTLRCIQWSRDDPPWHACDLSEVYLWWSDWSCQEFRFGIRSKGSIWTTVWDVVGFVLCYLGCLLLLMYSNSRWLRITSIQSSLWRAVHEQA